GSTACGSGAGASSRLHCPARRRELLHQQCHRLAAVADAVLDGRVEFGGGEVVFRVQEHRVVAEAVGSARCVQDAAFPAALGDQRLRIFGVAQQDEGTAEAGAAALVGDVVQRVEQ